MFSRIQKFIECPINFIEQNFSLSRLLKIVDIFESSLETIESGTFDGLDLDNLYLYNNILKSLPENMVIFQINLNDIFFYGNNLKKLEAKEFRNLRKLRRLTLFGNNGRVSAEKSDERDAGACDCERCYLPDFIKYDDERAPTCFLE